MQLVRLVWESVGIELSGSTGRDGETTFLLETGDFVAERGLDWSRVRSGERRVRSGGALLEGGNALLEACHGERAGAIWCCLAA